MNSDYWYFIASGFFLMLLPIGFIGGFWLRGFFWAFARVKASSGRLVLVKLRSALRDYFVPGEIYEGTLRFSVGKNGRTLVVPKGHNFIYRAYNVYCVDVDEEKNAIYTLAADAVSGYDAEKYDSLIVRALQKPSFRDNKTVAIIVLLVVILIIGLVQAGMVYKVYQAVGNIGNIAASTVGRL